MLKTADRDSEGPQWRGACVQNVGKGRPIWSQPLSWMYVAKMGGGGTSLGVPWVILYAEGTSSIPGWGNKIPHAVCAAQNK